MNDPTKLDHLALARCALGIARLALAAGFEGLDELFEASLDMLLAQQRRLALGSFEAFLRQADAELTQEAKSHVAG